MKGCSEWNLVRAQGLAFSLVTTQLAVAARAGDNICHIYVCVCVYIYNIYIYSYIYIYIYIKNTKIVPFPASRISALTPEILTAF